MTTRAEYDYNPNNPEVYVGRVRVTGNKPEICTLIERREEDATVWWQDLFTYWFKASVACLNCSGSLADEVRTCEEQIRYSRFYQEIIWSGDSVLIKEVPRPNHYSGWYRLWFPYGRVFRDTWQPYVPFQLLALNDFEKTQYRSDHPTNIMPIGKLHLKGKLAAFYHGISYGWEPNA